MPYTDSAPRLAVRVLSPSGDILECPAPVKLPTYRPNTWQAVGVAGAGMAQGAKLEPVKVRAFGEPPAPPRLVIDCEGGWAVHAMAWRGDHTPDVREAFRQSVENARTYGLA